MFHRARARWRGLAYARKPPPMMDDERMKHSGARVPPARSSRWARPAPSFPHPPPFAPAPCPRGLSLRSVWSCRRCRSSMVALSVFGSARCRLLHIFMRLCLPCPLRGSAPCGRGSVVWACRALRARCPCRAPAAVSPPRQRARPLVGALASLGTSVVASLRFLSAGALCCVSRLQGFPPSRRLAGFAPCPRVTNARRSCDIL